jgi:ABC-2 type transport system ATP-binding protein
LKQQIGSERLEITVSEASNFDEAKKVVDEDGLHVDSERRTLSVVTKGGVHQLKQVLSDLDEAGIDVEGVSFRSPTLDDVFLTLTGHTTEQSNGETKAQQLG